MSVIRGNAVAPGSGAARVEGGEFIASGAIAIFSPSHRQTVGNFEISVGEGSTWSVLDGLSTDRATSRKLFSIWEAVIDPAAAGRWRVRGELRLSAGLAASMGKPEAAGAAIGSIRLDVPAADVGSPVPADPMEAAGGGAGGSVTAAQPPAVGPDVIVGDLHQTTSWGTEGGVSAFSIGTVSCNIGDAPLDWYANTNRHPVIAQNLYRLREGRFEQVGLSWLKHGFFALSETLCFADCQPTDGDTLGVHCSDPYSSGLNGQQWNLGPRWQVNPYTGFFNYPPANPPYSGLLARRLQVANADLDPAFNVGARYFAEGQYVSPDDAAAGNGHNNASFREVTVSVQTGSSGTIYVLTPTGITRRQQPAIKSWRESDTTVRETQVAVPGDGRFLLSAQATELGGGWWRYEYALQNLNVHRAGGWFRVPMDPEAGFMNIGFHDVRYHSGEPFSASDWSAVPADGAMTWSTESADIDPNANALRWGTLYNFRFDTNRPPHTTTVTVGLFLSGAPETVTAETTGPITTTADCNDNGVPDPLDIEAGTSADCGGNLIPDECESFPVATIPLVSGLEDPTCIAAPPGDAGRLFVGERAGRVRIFESGSIRATPFLDLTEAVSTSGEQGLRGLAFHPQYAKNGSFFVTYTDAEGALVVSRFQVSADPSIADPQSGEVLISVPLDGTTNTAGGLQFAGDGTLFVAVGDGGVPDDTFNRAQDGSTLMGKLLRLDVANPPTFVPWDNPFVNVGIPLDPIWALGLRRPGRIAFDALSGDGFVVDAGPAFSEINIVPGERGGGANFGWRCMDAGACTELSGCSCYGANLSIPDLSYAHTGADCEIVGGVAYRGCAVPNLQGAYLFADRCSGRIWSIRYEDGGIVEQLELTDELATPEGPIAPLAVMAAGGDGEVVLASAGGTVYRVVPDPLGGGVCGNGVLEPGEYCDDGNTTPGDGCASDCTVELGPLNDLCEAALEVGDGVRSFDTTGASTDGPDESSVCQSNLNAFGADIWFRYRATCSGTLRASLCGSGYNTMVAVYRGSICPAESSAIACNDDGCDETCSDASCQHQSELTVSVTACEDYLIRVGGFFEAQGPGAVSLVCNADPVVTDCDGNGVEDIDDIRCGTYNDRNANGTPDTCETEGDFVRGGRLYDEWWTEAALPEPSEDHPLWALRPDPTSNPRTGSATWRCQECHGWDYLGVEGRYGTGTHRTGFGGVLSTTLDAADIFTLLKEPPNDGGGVGVSNGHDYGRVLADTRINDLVAFVLAGAIDDTPFIDSLSGGFIGDGESGGAYYKGGMKPACVECHGADGTAINFGTFDDPRYLGTVATYSPWELLHKVRFGQPGAPMPSWLAGGGTTQGAADIGKHIQETFPADCLFDAQCDDGIDCTIDGCDDVGRCAFEPDHLRCVQNGVYCDGPELCDVTLGCRSAGNPCSNPKRCNESAGTCGCVRPEVVAVGPRYLAVTPQTEADDVPVAIVLTRLCGGATPEYVSQPSSPLNIAHPVAEAVEAAWLTPAQWGETVYISGLEVAPETAFSVEADCGRPGRPARSGETTVETTLWGDVVGHVVGGVVVPFDGRADVFDITAVVDGVKQVPGALPVYTLDLFGCLPDQRVSVIDIAAVVDAVRGVSHASGPLCGWSCP